MTLHRQAVKADIVARLTGNTIAGANVFHARSEALSEDRLPALAVHTPTSSGTNASQDGGHPEIEVTLDIRITALVADAADAAADTALDLLCEQVETLLLQDPDFVNLFDKILELNTSLASDPDGAMIPGAADITIRVQYVEGYPPLTPDDFTKLHADWDMASPRNDPQTPTGPDGQIDAQDDLSLPT